MFDKTDGQSGESRFPRNTSFHYSSSSGVRVYIDISIPDPIAFDSTFGPVVFVRPHVHLAVWLYIYTTSMLIFMRCNGCMLRLVPVF